MKLSNAIKDKIAEYVLKRPEFIDTTFDDEGDEDDSYLTYHAMEMFNGVVIQEEYMSNIENNTQYLFMDLHTWEIRECTEDEDNYMHDGDGNGDPFRELDSEYIISKTIGNKIHKYTDRRD